MRRSELDLKLSELAQKLLATLCSRAGGRASTARDVLAVGVSGSLGERDVFVVDEPREALALRRQFGGLLQRLPADITLARLRASLVELRPVLVDGAVVLLVADKRAPALDQLRAVLAREPVPRARLDVLCEAVLLSGLVAPRVHDEASLRSRARGRASTGRWWLVSAAVPAETSALDVFFGQPAQLPSR